MTPYQLPQIRLQGLPELIPAHARAGKALLEQVRELRRLSGAGVHTLRRAYPALGVEIRAQSIVDTEIITITSLASAPEAAEKPRKPKRLLRSGVVFRHESLTPSFAKQAALISNGYAEDSTLTDPYAFNAAWDGPGAFNGVRFPGSPVLIDESKMLHIHSHTYNEELDVHVTTTIRQRDRYGIFQVPAVYIGGVKVIFDMSGCDMIGARLYAGQLAIAFLSPDNDTLCVDFIPVGSLTYEYEYTYDPMAEIPRLTVAWEIYGENCVFDFHPTDPNRGTFIISNLRKTTSPTLQETLVDYVRGRWEADPGDPEAGLISEASGTQVVKRMQVFHAGLTTTIEASGSSERGEAVTYPFAVPEIPYFDPLPSPTYTHQTPNYPWNTESCAYEGILGSSSSMTASVSGSINRSYTLALTVTALPIWTGYDVAGKRLLWELNGDVSEVRSGAATISSSYSHSTGTTVFVNPVANPYYDPDWEVPDDPIGRCPNFYDLTRTITADNSTGARWRALPVGDAGAPGYWTGLTTFTRDTVAVSSDVELTVKVEEGGGWTPGTASAIQSYSSTIAPGVTPVIAAPNIYRIFAAPANGRFVLLDLAPAVHLDSQYSFTVTNINGSTVGTDASSYSGTFASNPARQLQLTMSEANFNAAWGIFARHVAWKRHEGALLIANERGAVAVYTGPPGAVVEEGATTPRCLDILSHQICVGTDQILGQVQLKTAGETGAQYGLSWDPIHSYFDGPPVSSTWTKNIVVSREISAVVTVQEGFVGPRLRYGVMYDAPLDIHVVTPYAAFTGDLISPTGAPTKHVFALGGSAVDISATLNSAARVASARGVNITNSIFTSDLLIPEGLF